jgi:hypothetical protein
MGSICKSFALFLTLIIAMSCLTLLIVKPTSAQVLPAPDFTIKFNDNSITSSNNSAYPTILNLTQNGITTYPIGNFTLIIDNIAQANYYLIDYNTHTYSSQWIPICSEANVTVRASSNPQTIIIISMRYNPEISYEFRVKAVSGIETNNPLHGYGATDKIIVGNVSAWNTKTITIPKTEPFPTLTVLVVVLIAMSVVITSVLLFRRHRKTTNMKR